MGKLKVTYVCGDNLITSQSLEVKEKLFHIHHEKKLGKEASVITKACFDL